MRKRGTFASGFGTVAAVGGSVIGLGNIWRFPYIAGENGGAAFILVYVLVSLLLSVPLMLSEFSIGRHSRRNAMRAFRKVAPGRPAWQGVGLLGIATALLILGFYSVIAGWALEFLREAAAGSFRAQTPAGLKENFDTFVDSGWRPVLWTLLFVAMNGVIVSRGIQKGIEKFNKVVTPLMFLILLGMAVNSFTLGGLREAVDFVFRPDFSKISGAAVMQAVGQSFFSMSLGMGIMTTYGSYLRPGDSMFRVAGTVAVSDVCIAILSGLAIFPAVFTFGISPTSGPELVFLTLPNIFAQMTGGYLIGILFFFLLFAAAITSSVSLTEVVVAYVSEEFRLSRRKASLLTVLAVGVLATLCALSQMRGSPLTVAGKDLFDLFDSLTSTYMMPVGGLLIVIFAGWVMKKELLRREITSDGRYGTGIYPFVRALIRFFVPAVIALLFLTQLGLLK